MAETFDLLADGQLAASEGSLHLAGAGETVIIKGFTLVNRNAAARTVNVYVKVSAGTSRAILPEGISIPGKAMLVYDGPTVILGDGDDLRGDASAATSVDYVIMGLTIT